MSEGARTIVINIRRGLLATPHKRRAKKAINLIREHVRRHFEGEDVVIDQSVNESIWKRGSERPPSKLTVEVEKDEDGRLIVRVPSEWRGGEPAPSMSTNTTQKAHTL